MIGQSQVQSIPPRPIPLSFLEAPTPAANQVVPNLDDINLANVHQAQQTAVVRLHIFVIGETHRMVQYVYEAGWGILSKVPADEALSAPAAVQANSAMMNAWRTFIDEYRGLIENAMIQAASIPFGTLAVMHRELVLPLAMEESRLWLLAGRPGSSRALSEQAQANDGLFTPQLQEIIVAAEQRVYEDGLSLSGRIWRLDYFSRQGISQIIMAAMQNGQSAWDTARQLERYLGAGGDCPRWTEERLQGLTKEQIAAGDATGLLRGVDCRPEGVAYNALRLARNEIQAVHHLATDYIFARMPWVTQEQIILSPDHPKPDVCDDVASGGDGGDGIYPKGTNTLPFHVLCLCYKTAVLMKGDDFVAKLRGWLDGSQRWPEMDSYATMLGGSGRTGVDVDLGTGIGLSMAYWLWENKFDLTALFWRMASS